ncbi:sugar-binding domain-containing protein [Sinomonas sp. ASV322]|uniref:sugar-binding transcriptional regulator n=1 Tax=Sinomonas sp. ASV322 TaxID=3041920 RepID=UPI0027DD3EE1|nr:sugar-binding domain-containing protein [Sinomonas sp. ASV322]MDQ4501281.1 sugar-binding domain-containing protein [Sinomonas sp. ASV322]
MPVSSGEGILAATVAQRYYVDGDSKVKIAADLGISRFRVARLLEIAVAEKIVRFTITAPLAQNIELSEMVRKRFGYRQVIVVDAPEDESDPARLRRRVGAAAASVLSDLVTDKDVLGIGWGRTMSAMATELTHLAPCPVVQLGGMAGSVTENSLELVRRVSEIGGGRAYPLFVPLVVRDAATAAGLRNQPGVESAMRLFKSITIGAVAVGSWDPPESQMREALDPAVREMLMRRGVAAEILATLIRKDGSVVTDIDDRTTALDYEGLRQIPELILVAAGANKANAIRSAIHAGLGTTLVTDRSLARALTRLP